MEALIGGGLNSIADAGHRFNACQTNWFRDLRQYEKLLTRCLVLATLPLVHFYPISLFIASYVALMCGIFELPFLIMPEKVRQELSKRNTKLPPKKKQPITDDVAPNNTIAEEQRITESPAEKHAAGQQQAPNKTDCANISPDAVFAFLKSVYVAYVVLLPACFIPTPLFLVILTAFSYALLSQSDQHEQQAAKLEDIFLQRIALPFLIPSTEKRPNQDDERTKEEESSAEKSAHADDDADNTDASSSSSGSSSSTVAGSCCQKLNYETQLVNYASEMAGHYCAILCYIAASVGTVLAVHYAPTSLLVVIQTAIFCRLLLDEDNREKPLSRAQLIDRCSVILIFLVVRSIPIGLVLFMLPAFSLAWLSQVKGQRLGFEAIDKEVDTFMCWLTPFCSPSSTDSVKNKQMSETTVEETVVVVEQVMSMETSELSFNVSSSELLIDNAALADDEPMSDDDDDMSSLFDNVIEQLPIAAV